MRAEVIQRAALAGASESVPAVELAGARLSFSGRNLWSGLDLRIEPGEFVAVLGPNGAGKTSLLRVLLGLQPLSAGEVRVAGLPAGRANSDVGYIPQRQVVDEMVTMRGRDLVGLGLDGYRWGVGLRGRRARRGLVDAALAEVGAAAYANRGLGRLSGGEQQRLRVAHALIGDPRLLLCDEPLLSLDIAHQRAVSELIDRRRRTANTAVVFVTHEINPVLPLVDRVLYIVDGRFTVGTPDEVMTSETLSTLYRAPVDVLRVREQLVVLGAAAALEHGCHPSEQD